MTKTLAWWVASLMVAALLAGCQTDGGAKGGATIPVPILNRWSGNDAGLKAPEVLLITSQAQLDNTGSTELSKLNTDFNTQSLVVVALGEKTTTGYWAHISGVQRRGDSLFVQGTANRPGGDAATGQAMTYPVDAVVIPRQDKVVVVNSEIESTTGQPAPGTTAAPAEAAPTAK